MGYTLVLLLTSLLFPPKMRQGFFLAVVYRSVNGSLVGSKLPWILLFLLLPVGTLGLQTIAAVSCLGKSRGFELRASNLKARDLSNEPSLQPFRIF